jgi:hypothetical protein
MRADIKRMWTGLTTREGQYGKEEQGREEYELYAIMGWRVLVQEVQAWEEGGKPRFLL